MSYIDLKLKKIDVNEQSIYQLENIIDENNLVVVLGSAGSGKTSILQKYKDDNSTKTEYIKVKNFIKLSKQIKKTTTILLLDGLDEYRSVSSDKTFVLSELGNKLSELLEERDNLKIVISCREMDWYGDADTNALKDEINQTASLYNILPLDSDLQNRLADLYNIDDKDIFLKRFSQNGFLDNPQMFFMLSEIWESNRDMISSKKMLYEKFIINAREHNNTHQEGNVRIERDDIFKYVGYIAFYYMFCGVEKLDKTFIDEIVSEDKGYKRELIVSILKTKLFQENKFIHRTIAEYSLAKYILDYKLDGNLNINKERVKSLFIKNSKVPTELRGSYAWLCSLSEDKEFIKVDPYYQAIHGDNSLYNIEQKKEILIAVKEYSSKNPYFFEFSQKMELDGFYDNELDDFFIEEFKEAIKLQNHYTYFIINIIVQAKELNSKIKSFVKEIIVNNEIENYYKRDFIQVFKYDNVYLIQLLNNIKDSVVDDNDDILKEEILRILYPKYVNHQDVVKYLMLYTSDVGGYCSYLYNTQYDDKYDLVDKIHQASFCTTTKPYLKLPYNLESFIEDYFLETLLKYPDTKTAQDIYDFITHFRHYYPKYDGLKFSSYRYIITDALKVSEDNLQTLANELYKLFIDEILRTKPDRLRIHNIYEFFNYKTPNNQSEVLLSKLDKGLLKELNLDLLFSTLSYLPRDKNKNLIISDELNDIVKEFHFEDEYKNWLKPKKTEWEIEAEQLKKQKLEKEIETKKQNEEYFSAKSDEDIEKYFGDLNWIADLFYVDSSKGEKYLEVSTLQRLKTILKNAVYNELIEENLLTINSLACDSVHAHRDIDTMYYVSLCLNDKINIEKIEESFVGYLYINALQHGYISNVVHCDFIEQIEKEKLGFVREILKKYIERLLTVHFLDAKTVIMNYISKEDCIKKLKNIATSSESNLDFIKNSILDRFLRCFGFEVSLNELNILLKIDDINTNNKNTLEALQTFNQNNKEVFTINMAISFYKIIKGHGKYEPLKSFRANLKVKIISYMMSVFSSKESIKRVNGIQSSKNQCADFLTSYSFGFLKIDELKKLSSLHKDREDIWHNKILNEISKKGQEGSDVIHGAYNLSEIKKFILQNSVVSKEDFFVDVYLKIEKLKQEIEDNRYNEKLIFYNEDPKKQKIEDRCRDIVVQRLKASYDDVLDLTKELHEGNKRVDINIRYKKALKYEVQVECKRDDNGQLYSAINNQLINKYFLSGVQYGIYLIFYFGKKRNKALMLEKVYKSLPQEYVDNIKIICIDLTL